MHLKFSLNLNLSFTLWQATTPKEIKSNFSSFSFVEQVPLVGLPHWWFNYLSHTGTVTHWRLASIWCQWTFEKDSWCITWMMMVFSHQKSWCDSQKPAWGLMKSRHIMSSMSWTPGHCNRTTRSHSCWWDKLHHDTSHHWPVQVLLAAFSWTWRIINTDSTCLTQLLSSSMALGATKLLSNEKHWMKSTEWTLAGPKLKRWQRIYYIMIQWKCQWKMWVWGGRLRKKIERKPKQTSTNTHASSKRTVYGSLQTREMED
jgi:hypothetical protein